jgi:DnaK suppressor protein
VPAGETLGQRHHFALNAVIARSQPVWSGASTGDFGDSRKQRNDQDYCSVTDNSKYRPYPFMNKSQREYFRAKLLSWRNDILTEAEETLHRLQEDNHHHPDLADDANSVIDRAVELRARDRQRKLIAKIDAALQRIKDGTYGYCEETGEPIDLKRLEARPIATLSVEAQERHEREEKNYRRG